MTKSILKSQKKKAKWAEILFVFLLILPWLLNTLIFWFGTNVQAFIMMFTSYDTKEFTLQNGGVGAVHHGEGRQSFIGASEYHKILFGFLLYHTYPHHHGVRAV